MGEMIARGPRSSKNSILSSYLVSDNCSRSFIGIHHLHGWIHCIWVRSFINVFCSLIDWGVFVKCEWIWIVMIGDKPDLSCKQKKKQSFINMLAAKYKSEGCDFCHADADADAAGHRTHFPGMESRDGSDWWRHRLVSCSFTMQTKSLKRSTSALSQSRMLDVKISGTLSYARNCWA